MEARGLTPFTGMSVLIDYFRAPDAETAIRAMDTSDDPVGPPPSRCARRVPPPPTSSRRPRGP